MSLSLGDYPKWQQERALKLHEICGWIDGQKETLGLMGATSEAYTRHKGTLLNNGAKGEKLLKLSVPSIYRWYHQWNNSARSPRAFLLDYAGPGKQVPADLITEFRRLCTLKGQQYGTQAYKTLVTIWRAGGHVKGLGTYQEWWELEQIAREQRGLKRHECPHAAPDFPFGYRALQNYAPSRAARKLGNFGIARAKEELDRITRDSSELRPCEVFVLDDKRADQWVLDNVSGLWTPIQPTLYFMMEVGSRYICSVVLRGASRILQKDVDAVLGHGLRTMGIGNGYATHILFEKGSVACTPGKKLLLEGLFPSRLFVHSTGMIEGSSYAGAFLDKASGKPTSKGMIEAFMRKVDIAYSQLPGQSGNRYQNQPAELEARINAAGALANIEKRTGAPMEMPLLTLTQYGMLVNKLTRAYNADRDHGCQGFHQILQIEQKPGEWLDTTKVIPPHEQGGF
jgi:hypothetical protein